jgi:tetratricopeptide (TPR) repeat protein
MQLSVPHWHHAPLPTFIWPARATKATGAEFIMVLPGAGENHIGRVKMHNAAKRNLVLTTVSSFNSLGWTYQAVEQKKLYQHIVSGFSKGFHKIQWQEVGDGLIAVAEHALGLRQAEIVERAGQMLINAPLPSKYSSIGRYYEALSISRRGDYVSSTAILEQLAASSATPLKFRARALKAIGGNHLDLGNTHESLRFFLEAFRISSSKHGDDLLTATLSPWMIAVIRSIDGDHKGALENLENLYPFLQLIAPDYPHYYYAYYNARAVELGELNRIEEAQAALRIALASPFGYQHPEMQATAKDISQKSRRATHSIVAISRTRLGFDVPSRASVEAENAISSVVPIGRDFFETDTTTQLDAEAAVAQTTYDQEKNDESSHSLNFKEPVSLLPFPNRFASSSNSERTIQSSSINALHFFRMSVGQKRSLVMEVAREGRTSGEILDNMLKAAGVIGVDDDERPVYNPNTINLEQRGCLEELISLWVEGEISPEDFAAVISALRDCKDTFRLHNILDQMISLSFRSTPERVIAEDKWRRVIETNLKTDLENEGALREKITLWIQGEISPEDFAAVLYALRGCPDDQRRNQVFDKMISYAFHQIKRPLETESEWRKRVEASLDSPQDQN